MNPPTIYLIGAGAIGLTYAYFLRQAGMHVVLIFRNKEQLVLFKQRNGFEYQIADQNHFVQCDAIIPNEINQSIDTLIICTKAFDVINALNSMRHLLHQQSEILIIHNGLGVMEQIQNSFPAYSISLASTSIGAYRKSNFQVRLNGLGKTILNSASFSQLFKTTNLDVTVEHNFQQIIWQKFIVNCAINPLTAIYRCKNGELLQAEHLKNLMREIVNEIVEVAELQQIAINNEAMCQQVFSVANHTANNYSSMLQDVIRKQTTEIDYLNGYVVSLAKHHNKKVLNNSLLTNIIKRQSYDYT